MSLEKCQRWEQTQSIIEAENQPEQFLSDGESRKYSHLKELFVCVRKIWTDHRLMHDL